MALKHCAFAAFIVGAACSAQALDWQDNSIGYRYGTHFAEPFNNDIVAKNIVNFTHVSGYKYGSNFLNADFLFSNKKDPVDVGSNNGAQEAYVVYRHTLDLGKVYGKDFKVGPVRGFGVSGGFDWNTKRDAGYNSKKRMLVAGPTVMFDVPGYLNVSVLELWESNAPYNGFSATSTPRYHYKAHPMLETTWGIPFTVGSLPLSFEGYALFIASKGKDEFGVDTASETNVDAKLMYDASGIVGVRKNTFKVGAEYQYWMNKFGNNRNGAAGTGAFARTPMIRAEYHF
ncbi:outer envelope protein [Propionivibrio dicarboxylicus]|uniref:Nucleoside-specific outer membrane channel protein Tsx n=1 Tax=Propionivibrio dicarboxylicus TaxID=83767 RepID=A0A1G8GD02_9RHOO|nr:outer envelope protein [Propionivibrio dicarboxylicus]SDH92216.1 Nucleoside-specific outer membrane channel protein Tsx [Propionivibrio dicarboxylicus]